MRKKRIAIVGRGTAGSQAVIHFKRFFPDHEISWHFDPNIPVQSVGEGSTLGFPVNLYQNLGFYGRDLRKVNGTPKYGIYKENWGTSDKTFFHDFPPPNVAYHFSATELQDFIYEQIKNDVNVVQENVDIYDLDVDYVFNASGKPKTLDDFNLTNYVPVNAAYVVQSPWDAPTFDYTLCIAKKHGWVFGIPLQNRCSIGYIYNKDITSEEEIKEDIQEVIDQYQLKPEGSPNKLEFSNYYRKQNYEDRGRIAHSGNSSFFLEPLEATSVGTMDHIQRAAFDIWTGEKTYQSANLEYTQLIERTELVIMLHYAAGSPFKTEFWEYAQSRGEECVKSFLKDSDFKSLYEVSKEVPDMRFAAPQYPEYGPWWLGAFVQNFQGLGLYEKIDRFLPSNS